MKYNIGLMQLLEILPWLFPDTSEKKTKKLILIFPDRPVSSLTFLDFPDGVKTMRKEYKFKI